MFDWTGTVVDEYEIDKNVCKNIELAISQKEKISIETAEEIYLDLLKGYHDSWEWYNYPLHGDILGIDWEETQKSELSKINILPHAIDILKYYREGGYLIFLLTNAVRPVIELRIDYLKMDKCFDLIVTSDDVESTKSTGKHLEHTLKQIKHNNVYMIGDSLVHDIIPAAKLGIISILCNFGDMAYFHTENGNEIKMRSAHAPDYTIKSLKELYKIIP